MAVASEGCSYLKVQPDAPHKVWGDLSTREVRTQLADRLRAEGVTWVRFAGHFPHPSDNQTERKPADQHAEGSRDLFVIGSGRDVAVSDSCHRHESPVQCSYVPAPSLPDTIVIDRAALVDCGAEPAVYRTFGSARQILRARLRRVRVVRHVVEGPRDSRAVRTDELAKLHFCPC